MRCFLAGDHGGGLCLGDAYPGAESARVQRKLRPSNSVPPDDALSTMPMKPRGATSSACATGYAFQTPGVSPFLTPIRDLYFRGDPCTTLPVERPCSFLATKARGDR